MGVVLRNSFIFSAILFLFMLLSSCIPKEPSSVGVKEQSQKEKVVNKETVLFLSTQFNPVEEATSIRQFILNKFNGSVIFQPVDDSFLYKTLNLEMETNPEGNFLAGGLHGDFFSLKNTNSLKILNNLYFSLPDRKFISDFVNLGKLNTDSLYYIPWMQAAYLIAANRKALEYLPPGAAIEKLTYNELILWGKNMYNATGTKQIGFPLGENGLMHRFLEGYLYPSYTGSTLKKFRSPEAVTMWMDFKELWKYVNPSSSVYSNMSQPFLTGDILVAWDHSARLIKALETEPEKYIVFPASAGIYS